MENTNEGYTYGEKLALVAQELMDPKEIGLASAEEAKLRILGDPKPEIKLGNFVTFEASVVPLTIRAEWARQEAKIVPFDTEAWMAEHKKEFRIQARLRCGTAFGLFDQTFSEPIAGLIAMMENAVARLREKLAEEQAAEANTETPALPAPTTDEPTESKE